MDVRETKPATESAAWNGRRYRGGRNGLHRACRESPASGRRLTGSGAAPASRGSAVRVEEPAKGDFGLTQTVFGQYHRLGFRRGIGDEAPDVKAVQGVPVVGFPGARSRNCAVPFVYPEIQERQHAFVDPVQIHGAMVAVRSRRAQCGGAERSHRPEGGSASDRHPNGPRPRRGLGSPQATRARACNAGGAPDLLSVAKPRVPSAPPDLNPVAALGRSPLGQAALDPASARTDADGPVGHQPASDFERIAAPLGSIHAVTSRAGRSR